MLVREKIHQDLIRRNIVFGTLARNCQASFNYLDLTSVWEGLGRARYPDAVSGLTDATVAMCYKLINGKIGEHHV